MFANIITPKQASVSGFASRRVVRLASGKLYAEYTASQVITRGTLQGLVSSSAAKYANISPEQIEVTMRCIVSG